MAFCVQELPTFGGVTGYLLELEDLSALRFSNPKSGGSLKPMLVSCSASSSPTAVPSLKLDPCPPDVAGVIRKSLSTCLTETHLDQSIPALGTKKRGKVRDVYETEEHLVMVTTDRLSAFDRNLASIPYKGQVLNQTSLWWFNNTQDIIPNAVVCAPHPNVTIAKKCKVFPVEFVVRGYLTGSTNTSLWTVYNNGVRNYCGNAIRDGISFLLKSLFSKNQQLDEVILTPTTKSEEHDCPISGKEIVYQGLMSQGDYNDVCQKALALFAYGQKTALERGLLLVDTKYEFGKDADGSMLLLDEVHTPDSSRYWIAASYQERFKHGLEPENIDKEFLRLWFQKNSNPYENEVLPSAPADLVCELAWRYIFLYETITGEHMSYPKETELRGDGISKDVSKALQVILHLGCKS